MEGGTCMNIFCICAKSFITYYFSIWAHESLKKNCCKLPSHCRIYGNWKISNYNLFAYSYFSLDWERNQGLKRGLRHMSHMTMPKVLIRKQTPHGRRCILFLRHVNKYAFLTFDFFAQVWIWLQLWMGTHGKGPSKVAGTQQQLTQWLFEHPDALGDALKQVLLPRSNMEMGIELPFLFKVLSVNKALSIQVHPTKVFFRSIFLFDCNKNVFFFNISTSNFSFKGTGDFFAQGGS